MHRRVLAAIESLESRQMLSLSSAGVEFRANTYTTLSQAFASIAQDGDGDFVVVWQSNGQDGSNYGIYGQRYNASGVAQGTEFRINTYTTNAQTSPAVAMDADGDFVVVWDSAVQDGSSNGIFGQRFSAGGPPQGGEFRINVYTSSQQVAPAVAMDVAGNFVVAWSSRDQDGNLLGTYARRYDVDGVAQGTDFRVNTYTMGDQTNPAVAMSASGSFVISWGSNLQDGSNYGVYAQRYNSAGVAQDGEFRINTYTTSDQNYPSVAMDPAGNFVASWQSAGQDGFSNGIYLQRYNAAGVAQGLEFRANTLTAASEQIPTIAIDAAGNFVVGWGAGGNEDGNGYGVFARRYTAAGGAIGTEFRVNTYTTSTQINQAIGMTPEGDFVLAWQSSGQDGNLNGIYAQRYDESTDTAGPVVADVVVASTHMLPYRSTASTLLTSLVVSFSENMSVAGGTVGATSITNPANWQVICGGVDTTWNISSIAYGFNSVNQHFEATVQLIHPLSGNLSINVKPAVQDLAGNALDGDFDGVPGTKFVRPFSAAGEYLVNTFTTGAQTSPAVATTSSGTFLVGWDSADQDGSGTGIFAREFNDIGLPVAVPFQTNSGTAGDQRFPAVAIRPGTSRAITWDSQVAGGSQFTGTLHNGVSYVPFAVLDSSIASRPSLVYLPSGFVLAAFESRTAVGAQPDIHLQATGTSSPAVLVNSLTTGSQTKPKVRSDALGGSVVTWESEDLNGNIDIYARRFDSNRVPLGTEFRVNTFTTGLQRSPTLAMRSNGEFVIAWSSQGQDGSGEGIYAQRYDATGLPVGSEFRVNSYTADDQSEPAASYETTSGNFAIVWTSRNQDGSAGGIYAQHYTSTGASRGDEFRVNTYTLGDQREPSISGGAENTFVIAWSSEQDQSSYGIVVRSWVNIDQVPTVAALAATPNPLAGGRGLTLSATGVTDNLAVGYVTFFRESNGLSGLQVGVDGDTQVGITQAAVSGAWSAQISTSGLSQGTYTYWAQATDSAGLTGAPVSTQATVGFGASGEFLHQTAPQKLKFSFNGNAQASFIPANLTLQRIGGGGVPAVTMLPYGTDGTNVVSFTLNSLLADGYYRATVSGAVMDDQGHAMGSDYLFDFFILSGDANHDRKVDVLDLTVLSNNWLGTGKTWSQADFNYDGLVNQADLGIMAQHWQQNLAAPAPPSPAMPTAVRAPARAPTRTPTRVIDLVTRSIHRGT